MKRMILGILLLMLTWGCAGTRPPDIRPVLATAQVSDDADDPAVYVHPADPSRYLIIGTNKVAAPRGALVVFGLDGKIRQTVDNLDRPNNVDVEHDEGVNHGIPEALQKRGYPIFSQGTLPLDSDLLGNCSATKCGRAPSRAPSTSATCGSTPRRRAPTPSCGRRSSRRATRTWWRSNSRASSAGHDAPVYSVIEEIFASAGTPFFAFRDLDENKAAGSIALRIDTIDYFLVRYRKALTDRCAVRDAIAREVAALERRYRAGLVAPETAGAW